MEIVNIWISMNHDYSLSPIVNSRRIHTDHPSTKLPEPDVGANIPSWTCGLTDACLLF